MISLTNYEFQWGRSEVVIIYPGSWFNVAHLEDDASTIGSKKSCWLVTRSLRDSADF